jgi:hypothetical protein
MPKIYSGGSPQNINLKDNQYNINVFYSLVIAGFLVLMYDYGEAEIIGYSLITFSIFVIFFITMNFASVNVSKSNNYEFFKSILLQAFPMLFVLFLLTWTIFLNIKYYNVINSDNLPSEYYTYSLLLAWLFIILLFLFKSYTGTKMNPEDTSDKLARYSGIFIFLIGIFNFWILTIMQIILKYYITDG